MMTNIKDFTGAVNINADITPITREKIDAVTPEKWLEMDINMLWDQRIILNNRVVKALQSGHAEIAKQVQKGIHSIDALLEHKAAQEEAKNTTNQSRLIR